MYLIKNENDTQKTIEIYEAIRKSYLDSGCREYRRILGGFDSSLSSVIFGSPVMAVYAAVFYKVCGVLPSFSFGLMVLELILLYVSTPLHEFLHGLGWAPNAENGFKSIYIYLPLGISDAYCHCADPLSFKGYICGNLLPFACLSIVPFILSCFILNGLLFYFALFSAFGCGSDLSNTLYAFRHRDEIFLDYPTDCGFTSYKYTAQK